MLFITVVMILVIIGMYSMELHGYHPNYTALLYIIPAAYLYGYAMGTILDNHHRLPKKK
jgi:hypothetical protein